MSGTPEFQFLTVRVLWQACQIQESLLILWIRCTATCLLLWLVCQCIVKSYVMKICTIRILRLRYQPRTLFIVIHRIHIMEETWFQSLIEVISLLITQTQSRTLKTQECQTVQATAVNTKAKITVLEADRLVPKATPIPTSSTTSTTACENDQ